MADFVQQTLVQALAWALVHFIWQGAAIALATVALLRAAASPRVRYAIGVGALAAMCAAPIATFLTLARPLTAASSVDSATAVTSVTADTSRRPASTAGADVLTPAASGPSPWLLASVVLAWFAGVSFFSVRLIGGWVLARRMARRAVRPAAAHIQAVARVVADRLELRRVVAVLESSTVAVPVLIGWLSPTVVLPAAALAGLTLSQLEALIAHELSHVRRHDFLVNLLQSAVEALLFYHPAVWWVSRRVRVERELCCDDLAVGVCDRLVYATALTDLAAMASPRMALAATDGDLVGRVRRLLGQDGAQPAGASRWAPALVLVLVAGMIVPVSVTSQVRPAIAAPQAVEPTDAVRPVPVAPGSLGRQVGDEASPPREERGILTEAVEVGGVPPGATVEIGLADVLSRADEIALGQQTVQQVEQLKREADLQLSREQEARAREAELEAAKREIDRMRKLFDVGLISASQLREAELALVRQQYGATAQSMEVAALRRLLEEVKARAAIGISSPAEVADLRAELEALQSRLLSTAGQRAALEAELSEARVQLERARGLVERGLMAPADLRDVEQSIQRLQERSVADRVSAEQARDITARYQAELQEYRRLVADTQQKRQAIESRKETIELIKPVVMNPTRPIAVGDSLVITITGEPDLPTSFRVKDDGTIRLPLLGSFKVVGQTAAQVRAAVGKQLADRKLGSESQVTVSVRREAREPAR